MLLTSMGFHFPKHTLFMSVFMIVVLEQSLTYQTKAPNQSEHQDTRDF